MKLPLEMSVILREAVSETRAKVSSELERKVSIGNENNS